MLLDRGMLVPGSQPGFDNTSWYHRGRMGALAKSAWPGITQTTPMWIQRSADVRGGMGFGLRGMGEFDPSNMSVDDIIAAIQKGMVAYNAQEVFNINLDRLQKGLAPIPTQYAAPTVNFGMAGVSTPMLLAGLALLLFLLRK